MAINMVREPSLTPNIKNIDDIIPMRYAYGNQDGYVIGKGTEINATNNGSSLTIGSGRIVLQGVEADIDANGVTLTIENLPIKKYFSVYLKVNLGANTVSIETGEDTTTYPESEPSDDLTHTSSGIAYLELYRFTAINGVISEVQKIAKAIEYSGTALVGYDINKGTVEERLTRLGFKQGVVSYDGVPQTDYSYASIKKQGKYVIFSANTFNKNVQKITVPQDFKPKAETSFIAAGYPGGFPTIANLKITIQGEINIGGDNIIIENVGWETN